LALGRNEKYCLNSTFKKNPRLNIPVVRRVHSKYNRKMPKWQKEVYSLKSKKSKRNSDHKVRRRYEEIKECIEVSSHKEMRKLTQK
jgi:hypothetical protein